MKKIIAVAIGIMLAGSLVACSGSPRLSNEYVTVDHYQGVEIEGETVEAVEEEDVDKVVSHMMEGYIAEHDLEEGTQITDEIVKETMSNTAETVEEYRKELRGQIQEAKEQSARSEEERKVWEKVMDNSEVKEYPKDRLKEVKQSLVDLYEGYAKEQSMEYEAYLEAIKLTDEDLNEAAEASVKQELVAEIIADKYGLKPTEEDFQKALEEYAATYNFSNVELLLAAVPEEEMRSLVIQDNVKSWLTDRCKRVETLTADGKQEE